MVRRAWALILGGVAALSASSWLPFISDDALISLRYAERFAKGLGLTWTDGERVEGYTDLLWVLLNVPATWLHVDALWWARVLGFGGLLTATWCVAFVDERPLSAARVTSGVLMATSAPLAVWAVGGLEHTFLAGLVSLGVLLASRAFVDERWFRVSVVLALVVLTRADGVVLVAGLLTGVSLASLGVTRWSVAVRRVAIVASAPLCAVVVQTLFRRAYYGQWVPNTALAKVSFNVHRVTAGVEWVRRGLTASGVLVVLAVAMMALALRSAEARRRALIPLSVALSWFAYVALVGGDIFPAWRQLVPGLAALCFVVAEGLELLVPRLPMPVFAVCALGVVAAHVSTQWRDPENLRGRTERWEWTGEDLGQKLERMFGDAGARPLLAVDAAGALPYWSRLPSLDMLGLNDAWIVRHPPPGFGTGAIGHELGDGAYVLRRKPDLIAFCGACGARAPCFVGGRQLVALPEFRRDYGLAFVSAAQCRGEFWVRQSDGPLAARRSDERIELSPWQLAAREEALIVTAEDGKPELRIDQRAPATAELVLPAGTWRVADEELWVNWRCGGLTASQRGPGRALTVAAPTRVRLDLLAREPRVLRGVALERLATPGGWTCTPDAERPVVRASTLQGSLFEHDQWDRGGALVFGARGARVEVDVVAPGGFEVSTDNNDDYVFTWFAGTEVVGTETLGKHQNGGGLTVRRVRPPAGVTAMEVTATGDGAYSIGHLTPLP